MEVRAGPATTMAMASQQLKNTMETQVAMLREQAESQQQIAQALMEDGLGQSVDVKA